MDKLTPVRQVKASGMLTCRIILAALIASVALSAPIAVIGRERLVGAGGKSCSAWREAFRRGSGEPIDQSIIGCIGGRIKETHDRLGWILRADDIIAEAARYYRRHADDTVADAAEFLWKLMAAPSLPAPSPQPFKGARNKTASLKFEWPVTGTLVVGFCGPSQDNGINLAISPGSEIRATESGWVPFAGDELRNLPNLILVRHDDGWVSAYAHNDEVLVKRGDHVLRGQVIATAGAGTVDWRRLFHFELRHDGTPVDPLTYLEPSAATTQDRCGS
jgi:murein DD-endopeptidase MepM/ murein hydrolase activator NlpD